MEIETVTLHDMHENVFFMINNKIEQSKISRVEVVVKHILENPFKVTSNVRIEITERYEVLGVLGSYRKEELFKTKSELLKSI